MNKVKPFFRVEIGASEKSADISRIRGKKKFFVIYLRPAKFKSIPLAFQKLYFLYGVDELGLNSYFLMLMQIFIYREEEKKKFVDKGFPSGTRILAF